MGKASSQDLRSTMHRHVAKGHSRHDAGRRFGVSARTAIRLEVLCRETGEALMADKVFDANHLRAALNARGAQAIIPAKCNRKVHIPHDEDAYKWCPRIKDYFSKIKEFRDVNTRYDKTDTSYEATWNIAATIIALR